MDIVVLAGGISTERDVSFATGINVMNALRSQGHRVILTDVYLGLELDEGITDPFEMQEELSYKPGAIKDNAPDIEAVKKRRKGGTRGFFGPNVIRLCEKADIVFMGLHGENGENGKVQAALDLCDIKYTGTGYLSSAMAMDKNIAKQLFRNAGVPTPPGGGMTQKKYPEDMGLTYPVVVKPCSGGSSVGVSIVATREEYDKAVDELFKLDPEIIVERYIKGREFGVSVIDGHALPVIEIAPLSGFYDYKNKYTAGSAIETCPAEIDEVTAKKMQWCAETVFRVLDLETYARMDFLLEEDTGEIFCLEANTLPGMTSTSLLPQEAAAEGVSFEDLCEKILEISLKKYE
ncbi:MAG: D-alanine--D-alanine ligase [Lachnospiraceae bacterium]|nr:D-alanine--D-alanine ligase [Lachnospiraceae bacterium]